MHLYTPLGVYKVDACIHQFMAGQRFESKQLSEQVHDMQLTFLLGEHQLSRQRSHMHRVTLNLYHLTATELILMELITDTDLCAIYHP